MYLNATAAAVLACLSSRAWETKESKEARRDASPSLPFFMAPAIQLEKVPTVEQRVYRSKGWWGRVGTALRRL